MTLNQDFLDRLKIVECHDSTYRPEKSPLVFSKAKGSLIWDVDGKEYIDLCAGFGALALGHASEALLEVTKGFSADRPMVEHAMGDVYPSEEKILFLETLKSLLPSKYEIGALALGGGQAVEIALKTAMLYTKKSGFIVFDDAYHGLDLGVLPLTAREDFSGPFKNWLIDGHVERLPYGAGNDQLLSAIKKLSHCGLAAIVAEPIQGRAGVRPPPKGWLSMLADVAHAAGGLLILDEVFTGFGRLGKISTAEDVDADISAFGKAIGGGFPMSACFAKKNIMAAWPESSGEAIHTGTFFGHPFSAAVGRRTLIQIKNQNLMVRSLDLGDKVKGWLCAAIGHHPLVKDIRGQGLMIGVEFAKPGLAAKLMDDLREKGVVALPSGNTGATLSITPALNIPEDLLKQGIERLAQCL